MLPQKVQIQYVKYQNIQLEQIFILTQLAEINISLILRSGSEDHLALGVSMLQHRHNVELIFR